MLTTVASVLALLGLALLVIGGLWFLIAAFRQSVLWGLGCLFLPFASLLFLILHWRRAREPFFVQLWGVAAMVVAVIVGNNDLPWPLG